MFGAAFNQYRRGGGDLIWIEQGGITALFGLDGTRNWRDERAKYQEPSRA